MSAVERLVTALASSWATSGRGPYSKHEARARELVDDALYEHAETLADIITDDSWSRRDRWGRYEREEYEAGMRRAAELIIPEVTD